MFEYAMRILLQHSRTGLYVRGPGEWTTDHQNGLEFEHSRLAMDFARDHRLNEVEIAARFTESEFDENFSFCELISVFGDRSASNGFRESERDAATPEVAELAIKE